jgi:hypothetical protein
MQPSKNILRFNSFQWFKLTRQKSTDFHKIFCRVNFNPLKLLHIKIVVYREFWEVYDFKKAGQYDDFGAQFGKQSRALEYDAFSL